MLSSMVKNCLDFFALKPPMVIFLITLCFMVVTTVSLTVYIKYNNDIINTDRLESWISLRKQLNEVDLCVSNKTNEKKTKFTEEHSFTTFITLSALEVKNKTTQVQAIYTLRGWQPRCPKTGNDDKLLTVDFKIPPNLIVNNKTNVCAVVKGPKEYLPQYLESACDPELIGEPASTLFYSSPEDETCDSPKVKVTFSNVDASQFTTFLTQADKNVIIVHLTWCTYTLLVIILIMVLYAVLHRHDDQQKTY